jgi:uncharacterized protein (TIGR02996 family)
MDDLLARIIAQPDDDALRAVYADVLHARGDHQGELITTQLALAAAGIEDADDLVARDDIVGDELARIAGLLRHSDEILNVYDQAWSDAVVGATHNDFAYWRRGFIESIELSVDSTPIETVARVLARTPLRGLNLDGRDRQDRALDDDYVAALATLPLAQLTRLVLYGFDVSGPALAAWFARLPALTSIQFSKTQRRDVAFDVGALAPLRELRHLDLDYLPLEASAIDHLGQLPLAATLEHLSIRTFEPLPNILAALDGRFPKLHSLVLAGNRAVDFRRLAPDARLPAKLGLRYAELSLASLEALVEHPAAGALEALDLERVALHDEGIGVIARSQRLQRLHTLNVDGTGIGDLGATALGQCASARLTDLDISNNAITTLGLANVVTGHALRRLRYVDRTNPVDGVGVAAIVARLATLRSLCVGPLGKHGMRILVESSALAQLRALYVSDPDPALGRLAFRELVVLRVFADVPLAVRRAILARALPALVVNE